MAPPGLGVPGGGVEGPADQREGAGREEERSCVDPQHLLDRGDGDEQPGQQRPGDLGGRVAGLDAAVGGNQVVVGGDQAGDGGELGGVEGDGQGGATEGDRVDPADRQRIDGGQQRDSGDHGRPGQVGGDHQALAVDPVDPGPDDQPEEQIRDELGGGGDAQVERRAGQVEHQQGQGEEGEGAAEVGDGLAQPEAAEITRQQPVPPAPCPRAHAGILACWSDAGQAIAGVPPLRRSVRCWGPAALAAHRSRRRGDG